MDKSSQLASSVIPLDRAKALDLQGIYLYQIFQTKKRKKKKTNDLSLFLCLITCRMESKEKCEQIIQMFNGKALAGAKDPLLVKFADGGNKKKSLYKSAIWRETSDVSVSLVYT